MKVKSRAESNSKITKKQYPDLTVTGVYGTISSLDEECFQKAMLGEQEM